MARKPGSSTIFSIALVLCFAGSVRAAGEEAATAWSLFARAETLYRHLSAIDPLCSDRAVWGTLALAFSEIPDRFPADPLAGDALWRIGDIHSRQLASGLEAAGSHARGAYGELIARYPANEHAPDAMLRIAEMRDQSEARTTYFQLLDRYPGTASAEEARRRLANRATESAHTVSTVSAAPPTPASRAVETTTTPLDAVPEAGPTLVSGAESGEDDTVALTVVTDTAHVLGVRHYSDLTHTRVVIDLDRSIDYRLGEAKDPPRLFVDLVGVAVDSSLARTFVVAGTAVRQIRLGVNRPGVVRAVLDLTREARYSMFTLANPSRLVIDVAGPEMSRKLASARRPSVPEGGSEARALNLGVRRVVIDPGHGGGAPGAIGRSGLTEKDLALDIARRLATNLRASDYEVVLTRDADRDVPLEARPIRARDADADLFVSIHVNSANNRSLSGFETYYLDLATDPTAVEVAARENAAGSGGVGRLDDALDEIVKTANKRESRDLAHSIQDSLVMQISKEYQGIRDLGVKHAPFIVLVGAEIPAVLVECSFLSNTIEEGRLRHESYRQHVADAIHIGIENYVARRRMLTSVR